MVEDEEPHRRMAAFNGLEIISIVCFSFTPVAGWLIGRFSLITAMRGIYLTAAVAMAVCIYFKQRWLRETRIGAQVRASHLASFRVSHYADTLRAALANRILLALYAVSILINFTFIIINLYYFPLLTRHYGFSDAGVSVFPFLTAVVALVLLVFVTPRIRRKHPCLLAGLLLHAAGTVCLMAAPVKHPLVMVLANVVLWAAARSFINIILQSEIANRVDERLRANTIALFNILSTLCTMPAGLIGGLLYELSPLSPFWLVLVIYVFNAGLLATVVLFPQSALRLWPLTGLRTPDK
jgi:hypothetical protein